MIREFFAAGAVLAWAGAVAAAPADPYAPLALYNGAWSVQANRGATIRLENHCARAWQFYSCEQVVNGKSAAMVVYLPTAATAAVLTYRTEALAVDGRTPGDWTTLTIRGDDWVYTPAAPKPGQAFTRVLNHFTGPDRIHFDIQSSADGKTWTTTSEGDEQRLAKRRPPIRQQLHAGQSGGRFKLFGEARLADTPNGSLQLLAASPVLAGFGHVDSGAALVAAARRQNRGRTKAYDRKYHRIAYPNGDIPIATGVCADVVVRAARDAWGVDLQRLVHEDMIRNFAAYPRRRGLVIRFQHRPPAGAENLETYWRS